MARKIDRDAILREVVAREAAGKRQTAHAVEADKEWARRTNSGAAFTLRPFGWRITRKD